MSDKLSLSQRNDKLKFIGHSPARAYFTNRLVKLLRSSATILPENLEVLRRRMRAAATGFRLSLKAAKRVHHADS